MRIDIVVGGLIILIMGIGGYMWMKDYLTDCEDATNTTTSLSAYLGEICEQLKLVQSGTIFSAATGFCIIIYGMAARKQISKTN